MSEQQETKQILDPIEEEKERSRKYLEELRRVIQTRVLKDDGTLGEAGVLPHDQLVQHYLGKPLPNKDKE